MDFTFSEEQQALREALSRYLDRTYTFDARQALIQSDEPYSAEVWTQLTELGLTALPFGESDGGLDGTIADIVAVSEVLGEHLCVEPYAATVLMAGRALAAAGASELLADVISGERQVAFAHEEGRGTPSAAQIATSATSDGDGYRVSGRKELVLGGAQAGRIVVTARIDGAAGDRAGTALLLVDPTDAAVSVRGYRTIDGRAAGIVELDNAPAQLLLADAADAIDDVIDTAAVALAAEAVGAMGVLLATTVEYGSTRQQFGVPIGSFQALAHRIADMKIAFVQARATLLYTTALLETGQADRTTLPALKAQVGRLGRAIGESAVQVHGGIGTTDELPVGHYLKRVLAVEAMFGDTDHHLRELGSVAGVKAS